MSFHGVAAVSSAPSGSIDNITLRFKPPASLGTGTYVDTLNLEGCYDQACTQQISNSPLQVLWSFAGDGQLSSAPVVNNYVFVGSGGGNLYALDASTGQQVWTRNLGAAIPPSAEYGSSGTRDWLPGDGLLVVPNGSGVTAYTLSTSPLGVWRAGERACSITR